MSSDSDALPRITETAAGVVFSVHVQPRASRNELCGVQGDALKIRLTSPPVDGAANKLCREFLADLFHVPKSAVEIISGETSRRKRVKVTASDTGRLQQIVDSITA